MTANVPEHTSDEGTPDAIRVRRAANRAAYDPDTIYQILDDGYVAHVGTIRDGAPLVIPMFYARDGHSLLLHGAPATGAIRRGKGLEVCVTVTHLDALKLARSAFHHSMNYRSVVVLGVAEPITDPEEKAAALEAFVDKLVPGRQGDLRPNNKKEVDGTGVLRLSLEQASAKVNVGEPIDDDEDYALPIWAGIVPIRTVVDPPITDSRVLDGVTMPANVAALGSPSGAQ